jgi:2-oxoglutarate dehydrogenase E2 component (dihydrolipoamide succinyltransferase)
MPIELKVPEVGESITEVQIAQWHKRVGDLANKDENLVEIESDKATVELPSPVSGTLTQILKQSGQPARVGEVIGYMTEGAVREERAQRPAEIATAAADPSAAKRQTTSAEGTARQSLPEDPRVMPAAERLMAQEGIAVQEIEPSGPGRRVLKEDVQRAADRRAAPTTPSPSAEIATSEPLREIAPTGYPREEEYVVMSPIRQRIAQRLVEAQHSAALLTTFNEVDMAAVIELRKRHREQYEQHYGVKLGFMSFFVKAVIDALKSVPQLNAEVREPHIVYRNYYDIGIAVGGGKGLVVPILRNAEFMSFAEIEQKIADFARRAADNKLKLEELQGGTFTISNGGVYGSMLSTPIINPPQSGILGLHAIQDRPAAKDGQVVVRPMMYIALTYDHRIVDGREAVLFLKRIKDVIEEPSRMLLEI